MPWAFKNSWVATDKPTYTDFNHIAQDIQIWGGNVNAGGFGITNLTNGFNASGTLPISASSVQITSTGGNALQLSAAAPSSVWAAFIINQTNGGWGLYDNAAKSYIASQLQIGTNTSGLVPFAWPLVVQGNNPGGVSGINVQNLGAAATASTVVYLASNNDPNSGLLKCSSANTSYAGPNSLNLIQTGGVPLGFVTSNVLRMSINSAGGLQLVGDSAIKLTTTTWTTGSDARIKTEVRPFQDGLATLLKINPVRFTYNGKGGTPKGVQGIGLIAQEAQKVVPYCVSTLRGKLEEDDAEETDLLGVNTHALFFVLINAIKELAARLPAVVSPKA